MENLKERVIEIFLTFCMATTGSVFVCAVYGSIFWRDELLPGEIMWQTLLISFRWLGNFIYPYWKTSRRRAVLCKFLHYLYINVVILTGGYVFHWIDIGRENVAMMAFFLSGILFIYTVVSCVIWGLHKRESEKLNQKLLEYQSACGRTESMKADTNFTVDKP